MGKYVIKYQQGEEVKWAVHQEEKIFTLRKQPSSLKDLIKDQGNYLGIANIDHKALQYTDVEILAPVSSPLRVICQGLNYASHREESALRRHSTGNVMFAKDESAIIGAFSPVMRPKGCDCLDYEAELALVIRQDIDKPTIITQENLHEYVAGITIANDLSPRDLQYREDYGQWFKAKSCRTMLPLGPRLYLMDKEDFPYLRRLTIHLWVNDSLRQNANTFQMIFKPEETLTEISGFMNLAAGDVVLTGTPGGVVIKAPGKFLQGISTWLFTNEKRVAAIRKNKDQYLKDGDIIRTRIYSTDGKIDLGTQSNKVVAYGF